MKRSCGFEVGSKNAEQLKIIMVTPVLSTHWSIQIQKRGRKGNTDKSDTKWPQSIYSFWGQAILMTMLNLEKEWSEGRPKKCYQAKYTVNWKFNLPIIYIYGIFPIDPKLGILTHIFKFYLDFFFYLLL